MNKILAHDIINDVCLIQTTHKGHEFNVRYGLQIHKFDNLKGAVTDFNNCQRHALTCEGHKP